MPYNKKKEKKVSIYKYGRQNYNPLNFYTLTAGQDLWLGSEAHQDIAISDKNQCLLQKRRKVSLKWILAGIWKKKKESDNFSISNLLKISQVKNSSQPVEQNSQNILLVLKPQISRYVEGQRAFKITPPKKSVKTFCF